MTSPLGEGPSKNKANAAPYYSDDLALELDDFRSHSIDTFARLKDAAGGAPSPKIPSPTPIMEDTASNHRRRRSSSLASLNNPSGAGRTPKKKNLHRTPGDIDEADEDKQSADGEDSSSSKDNSGSSDFELGHIDDDSGLDDDEETGLTGRERQKRRRRKRRNTRLDERVAGGIKITKEEEQEATRDVIRNSAINVVLILLWYAFSIAISLYNKWMFKEDGQDGEAKNVFPFPLFTTALHQLVQFSLAALIIYLFPQFRPRHDSLDPHHGPTEPPPHPVDSNKPLITKWFYFSRIGPCGVATGFDIGLGNMSLRFISLTFFTMCKSSALGFVLLFAFLFRLEQPSWRLVGVIGTMTVGVIMMVAGETAFNALGFILVMTSSCSSGFRWSLTQILLLRHPATSNPFSTILFLAPVIFIALFIIAIPIEGIPHLIIGIYDLMEARGSVMGFCILLFPGLLAFSMMTAEFALLKRTSVVTLSICGIFKEVAMVIAASVAFDDKLTAINVSGLAITICSIATYNYMKVRKMKEEAMQRAHLANEEYAPILASDPDSDTAVQSTERRLSSGQPPLRGTLTIPSGSSTTQGVSGDSPARSSPLKRPEDLD